MSNTMNVNRLTVALLTLPLACCAARNALAEQYGSEKPFAHLRPPGYRYNPYSYLVDPRETRALAYLNSVSPEARRAAVTPEITLRDYVYRSPYLPIQPTYKPYQKPLPKPWAPNTPFFNYGSYYSNKPTTPQAPGRLAQ